MFKQLVSQIYFLLGGTPTAVSDTDRLPVFDSVADANFDAVRMLQWRNRELDFGSLERLKQSLNQLPQQHGLTRAQPNADLLALEALARDPFTYLAKCPAKLDLVMGDLDTARRQFEAARSFQNI